MYAEFRIDGIFAILLRGYHSYLYFCKNFQNEAHLVDVGPISGFAWGPTVPTNADIPRG